MGRRLAIVPFLLAVLILWTPIAAEAGPGGQIASAVFHSFWGKVLLGVLTVVLSPLIVYILLKERRAERRTLADLKRLAAADPRFDWLLLKERVSECFHQVHGAWRKEEMARATGHMTDWYWRNQQLAYLDRWAEEGLINHCTVKRIHRMRPLFLAVRGEREGFAGTRLAVAIKAEMEDFLAERQSGKVVEGARGFREIETVWTMALDAQTWKVAMIEPDEMTLAYARMMNEVPASLPPPAVQGDRRG